MPMPYIISVLLFLTHEHIITHQQFVFAWTMLISHIIQVLLFITHKLILFFLINTFSPHFGWFFLSRLTFVQFGFHSVVSSYAWFILFYCVTSLGSTHFSIMFIPHCKYFFLSSCTRNMAHNAVNTRSQSLLHRKYTCTRPVWQMPFGVKRLKIEDMRLDPSSTDDLAGLEALLNVCDSHDCVIVSVMTV